MRWIVLLLIISPSVFAIDNTIMDKDIAYIGTGGFVSAYKEYFVFGGGYIKNASSPGGYTRSSSLYFMNDTNPPIKIYESTPNLFPNIIMEPIIQEEGLVFVERKPFIGNSIIFCATKNITNCQTENSIIETLPSYYEIIDLDYDNNIITYAYESNNRALGPITQIIKGCGFNTTLTECPQTQIVYRNPTNLPIMQNEWYGMSNGAEEILFAPYNNNNENITLYKINLQNLTVYEFDTLKQTINTTPNPIENKNLFSKMIDNFYLNEEHFLTTNDGNLSIYIGKTKVIADVNVTPTVSANDNYIVYSKNNLKRISIPKFTIRTLPNFKTFDVNNKGEVIGTTNGEVYLMKA